MKKRRTGFEEELGLDEQTPIELEEVNVISNGTMLDIEDDYKKIREATIKTIIRTSEIIDESAINIKQNPNGMMVKAYADLVKSMKDNTMALLEMHREIRKLTENKTEETKVNVNKTNVTEIINYRKANSKE